MYATNLSIEFLFSSTKARLWPGKESYEKAGKVGEEVVKWGLTALGRLPRPDCTTRCNRNDVTGRGERPRRKEGLGKQTRCPTTHKGRREQTAADSFNVMSIIKHSPEIILKTNSEFSSRKVTNSISIAYSLLFFDKKWYRRTHPSLLRFISDTQTPYIFLETCLVRRTSRLLAIEVYGML